MATTKKFLDLTGLGYYDGKIKSHITTEIGKLDTAIRTDYKVKNVDTTVNDKVSLTLNENGVVGVTVDANVVKDSEYSTVKANANNSAAAWGKFLEGTLDSATNPAPKLSELATTANVTSAIATAKGEAITRAGELDTALEGKITTAYQGADETVKSTLIGGESTDSDNSDTIWGAKKYAGKKAATAKAAADAAQAAADAAKDAADAAQNTADTAVANAAIADGKAVAAQKTADEIKTTTIPTLQSSLEGKINDNTTLITTTKAELIGGESDTKDSNSIKGAKLYADDLADGLSARINDLVAGGVEFKGVVTELPSPASDGDLIIMGADVKVGDITYKKDYEYIYSKGAWYELGDSDKNAKAIAEVDKKADANATAIQRVETEYKDADTTIKQSIETLSNAAVKSIAVTDNSDYVTVEASVKGDDGKVTLTVSDSIAATFDTIESVNGKISTAKTEVSGALIGKDNDGADALTIKGAKKYADGLVSALDNSFVAITNSKIDELFTVKA